MESQSAHCLVATKQMASPGCYLATLTNWKGPPRVLKNAGDKMFVTKHPSGMFAEICVSAIGIMLAPDFLLISR